MNKFVTVCAAVSLASLAACGAERAEEEVVGEEAGMVEGEGLEMQEEQLEEQADMADEMGMEVQEEQLEAEAEQVDEVEDEM